MDVDRRSRRRRRRPREGGRRRLSERRRRAPYREPNAVQAYWNAHPHGAEYAQQPDVGPGTAVFFERIRPWMSPYRFPGVMARIEREADLLRGKRLLDLGCGLGYDSIEFLRRGVRVTAADVSGSAVALARKHFTIAGVRADGLEVASALALPYADGTFDAVWSDGVLYYTGDMPRALREIWRVLRAGGQAIVSHLRRRPSWMDLLSRLGRAPIEFKDTEPPVSEAHTEAEILAMFGEFEVIETTRDQYRARPIARSGWKAQLYRWCFRPVYNAVPRGLAKRWASKFSVVALKP
jgi:ubiquinone/menaquinone biosynthesis C-methylase UbiE